MSTLVLAPEPGPMRSLADARGGRVAAARLFCAAMAILLAATAAVADELIERLRPLQTWEELCATVDCSQFPMGYSTHYINGEYYYFPLAHALKVVPESWGPATFNPEYGRFIDRDAENRITRSFGYVPGGMIISYCCNWLLNQTDLADAYPEFMYRTEQFPMYPARVVLITHDPHFPSVRIAEYINSSDIWRKMVPSYDAIDKSDWISLNDGFWLFRLSAEPADPDSYHARHLILLSKMPMFNGYYIFGDCYRSSKICTLWTVPFSDDVNDRLHLKIQNFFIHEYQPRDCDDPSPVLNCDGGLEVFDKIGPAFGVLETMFERLKVRPEDVYLREE